MDRILIADANESMRRMLRALLEGVGFQVVEAGDGIEAVQRLTQDRPDLLLLDLRLPKCEGNVMKAISGADPLCRIIIMAAYGDIEGAVRAVREGAHDFLTKPIDPDRVLQTVRRTLEGWPRPSSGGGPGPTRSS